MRFIREVLFLRNNIPCIVLVCEWCSIPHFLKTIYIVNTLSRGLEMRSYGTFQKIFVYVFHRQIIQRFFKPSVLTLHLPGVSCKQLFSYTKVTISPLHLGSPNSKSKPISNSARTAKSFRLSNRINNRFSKICTCNAGRCLTCHHISCESTITFSINGNKYGIKIDKDVD